MDNGMAGEDDCEIQKEDGDQRIVEFALQAVNKGTGNGKYCLGKCQNWSEKGYQGGKGGKDVGKNPWQRCSGKKGSKVQEKGVKGETRACWTCGKTGHIAAWNAVDEDDSEIVKEATDNEEDMQAWCLIEESANEK